MLGIGTGAPVGRTQFSRDGFTYIMDLAPGRMSLRQGLRVAGVLAPVGRGVMTAKSSEGSFAAALIYLFGNPALEEVAVGLVDAFAPHTQVIVDSASPPQSFTLGGTGPQGPWVDVHFAGRQDALLDWLGRACDQNLSSFLGGLLAKAKEAEAALEALGVTKKPTSSESPKPAEKTGSSGA